MNSNATVTKWGCITDGLVRDFGLLYVPLLFRQLRLAAEPVQERPVGVQTVAVASRLEQLNLSDYFKFLQTQTERKERERVSEIGFCHIKSTAFSFSDSSQCAHIQMRQPANGTQTQWQGTKIATHPASLLEVDQASLQKERHTKMVTVKSRAFTLCCALETQTWPGTHRGGEPNAPH